VGRGAGVISADVFWGRGEYEKAEKKRKYEKEKETWKDKGIPSKRVEYM
jgi:hypothetical protein